MPKPNSRDRRSRGSRLVRLFRPQNCGAVAHALPRQGAEVTVNDNAVEAVVDGLFGTYWRPPADALTRAALLDVSVPPAPLMARPAKI